MITVGAYSTCPNVTSDISRRTREKGAGAACAPKPDAYDQYEVADRASCPSVAPEGVRDTDDKTLPVKAARKIPKFTASPTASITAAIIAAHVYRMCLRVRRWALASGSRTVLLPSSEKARTRSSHDLTRSRETLSREISRAETLLCDATFIRADIIVKIFPRSLHGAHSSTHA